MDDPCVEHGASSDAALLAHEATHIALDYLRCLGESEPSEELMAYTVQGITAYLVERHFKWKRKHL